MLELRHIQQHYADQPLLQDINLRVAAGEIVALLGPSGSGKSTLLNIVAGLQVPDAGSVWFDGQDITDAAPEQRRFALMFQDFALFPHLNVQDNTAFGLVEQGLPKREARDQALQMLGVFGLSDLARRRVWNLSGGEQQRVALARALITQPRVLLLDEPFSALDADLRVALREEFRARIQTAGMPTLLVTHDETEASDMADRSVRLVQGQLVDATRASSSATYRNA
ncbi:ABC transporter ATP-binding protein [Rhodoferax antarcticus]|uniref:ABC transporter family protein n=1 Tax=Rhodoferax antarcticus ANT.BR TaxID=1111071 RepID=A0A1Q8Y9H7_9BURK|nr:ABC transporter ATP-binding protein [Rhodoferax antarcticus]APW47246.1 ABC transporter [Rhodoferax antarcticus]OLP04675.1 ABC transporter family protein [Rhodoferax antarcticus ANT.BR]